MTLLNVQGLQKSFGGVAAVRNCSFSVREASITGLIGPNGAGKTTVFNLITGLISANGGRVSFKGELLSQLPPHAISRLGISRTFQMLRLFPQLTALENLMIAHPGTRERMFDTMLSPVLVREEESLKRTRCLKYLGMVGMASKAGVKAGDLSYGQQKLVDIARSLATEAELLLLDEPVAGVSPKLRASIAKLLQGLRQEGRTILLIEHDMNFVMGLCDEVVVLDHGEEIAVGPPGKIKKHKKVIEAYLGKA